MTRTSHTSTVPLRPSRFGFLMGLYGDNYWRLQRLFHPSSLEAGCYASSVGDGLDLRLEVLVRHAYTVEIKLTYDMIDPQTGESDPSAFLRLYNDARLAEATHCYLGRNWQDTLGLSPPAQVLLDHRLRMNTFLNKWLEYLIDRGHSRFTLRRAGGDCSALPAVRDVVHG